MRCRKRPLCLARHFVSIGRHADLFYITLITIGKDIPHTLYVSSTMFEHLAKELYTTAMTDFCYALKKYPDEHFYSAALFTCAERSYVVVSVSTLEGLEKVAREYMTEYPDDPEYSTLESSMQSLKWSPCDSPYHADFMDHFDSLRACLLIQEFVGSSRLSIR